ncbi:CFEM domain containing protein [Metarhizium rileyi]|uniref:CFEM domain containing protein n=1 Tax=Metarhizium rileyi (strain RCEF 4871) TaxID=1649241 RepID=A0A162JMJ6_METRR|nr:CFEM domain containing protein [Metarhizium rileyi RCEF 4871]
MKSAVFALTLVAAAAAQDVSALAQCGQTCANNMMAAGKAEELGCKASDLKCLCSNANFLYGLRDCSRAICSDQDANKVVEYGVRVCKDAGVEVTGGNGGNGGDASQTGTKSGDATHTGEGGSGVRVTTIYGTETGTDGKVITTPVATSTISGDNGGAGGSAVTYTTNGSQVVTTIATAVTSPTGSESPSATETGSKSGSESSTSGSGSESTSEGNGSASRTSESGSGSETTASSGNGGASSTSTGLAAHITAAPGILAVAGLAALLI